MLSFVTRTAGAADFRASYTGGSFAQRSSATHRERLETPASERIEPSRGGDKKRVRCPGSNHGRGEGESWVVRLRPGRRLSCESKAISVPFAGLKVPQRVWTQGGPKSICFDVPQLNEFLTI
jgi:hypothetical protein